MSLQKKLISILPLDDLTDIGKEQTTDQSTGGLLHFYSPNPPTDAPLPP